MRLVAAFTILLVAALALGGSSAAQPRAQAGAALRHELARAGEAPVIVAFRPQRESPRAVRARLFDRLGARGFRPTARWDAVSAVPGVVDATGLARLLRDPDVLRVDLDRGGRGGTAESLPLVRGDAAHAAGVTGRGVTIAVLDSGIDRTHPDLADALVGEHCFVFPNGCPNGQSEQDGPGSAVDDNGHGTNVTGIALANGTVVPRGVAPDASVVSVKVLDRNNAFRTSAQVISGLNWLAVNRPDVRVVNMSLGTFQLFSGNCDSVAADTLAFASAVSALRARGVVVFAGSGNDASASSMSAPACNSGVIAVGAVYDSALGPFSFGQVCSAPSTAADQITCFSNGGAELDLLAPGAWITSTGVGSAVSTYGGTSQASPHAAGAAALLLQANAALTPDAVESTLESTGLPITDARNGITRSRLDIAAALQLQPPPAPPPVADIALSRRTVRFARVVVGRSRVLPLAVANRGTAPLTVRSSTSRPFSVASTQPLTVAPGATGGVRVRFAPRAAGAYRQTLVLRTNDPDERRVTVTLLGTGARR